MPTIQVTDRIAIDEKELSFDFVRASGPGGQNVNKVATAVQMRFDVFRSPNLDDETKRRLARFAGQRLTGEGVIVISAERYRSQERNRADAIERLVNLIRQAAEREKPRRATRPTLASKKRRVESKSRRGETKRLRGNPLRD
jgi:ribosome-associated protein